MKLTGSQLLVAMLAIPWAFVSMRGHAGPYLLDNEFDNPAPAAQDFCGMSVAWVGTKLAYGCFRDDLGTQLYDVGLVFVMDADPNSVTYGTLLDALYSPQVNVASEFGHSMTVVGDHLVVGSRYAGTGFARAGAAYLFASDASGVNFNHLGTFANPRPGPQIDSFGFAVTPVGDMVLVGAFLQGETPYAAGAAYLFNADPQSPTFSALINTFENPQPGLFDMFGVAATAVGAGRVLIGAFRDDTGGIDSGTAYLYDADPQSSSFGSLLYTFLNPTPAPSDPDGKNDEFGHSMAALENYVLIGALRDDHGAKDAGSVHMFDADPQSPTFGALIHTFHNPTPAAGENFGFSIVTHGTDVFIGAWRAGDAGVLYGGAVYVFDGDLSSPSFGSLKQTITPPNAPAYDTFGTSLAIQGGMLAVGAIGRVGGAGAVFVYRQ